MAKQRFIIKHFVSVAIVLCAFFGIITAYRAYVRYTQENKILKQVIERLEADSRIAEALVTEVHFDETSRKNFTTIKFLEYDSLGEPLRPRYFTFSGNIIQFQTLVIRFHDLYVRNNDALRGRSAYLFWKVFMLDGKNTKEYDIAKVNSVPQGYAVSSAGSAFEKRLWEKFWSYALDPERAKGMGIKNAQIEAPGTAFIPGTLYVIKIEHDGGIRIDALPLPQILRGERIPR